MTCTKPRAAAPLTRRLLGLVLLGLMAAASSSAVQARGWESVHRFVHKTGKCGAGREVLATLYTIGTRTASGEPMRHDRSTAASHEFPLGTVINVTNPATGQTCEVRINDRGPYGRPRDIGVKIDFTLGAARCLGMRGTQYVCLPSGAPIELAGVPKIIDINTFEIGARRFSLADISAPTTEQTCIDANGERWACGLSARDELMKFAAGRPWSCKLKDGESGARALATCIIDDIDVAEWIVANGWALVAAPGDHPYRPLEARARSKGTGLWSGAFIAPWEWRGRTEQTEIIGEVKSPASAHDILFSPEPAADECRIKATFERNGKCSYQLPGSRGYDKIKMDLSANRRWFCSAGEAQAMGCRAQRK